MWAWIYMRAQGPSANHLSATDWPGGCRHRFRHSRMFSSSLLAIAMVFEICKLSTASIQEFARCGTRHRSKTEVLLLTAAQFYLTC